MYDREYGGGPGHVVNHVSHFRGGLERNAAGIKGDSLSDENNRGFAAGGAVVAKLNHCGRYGAALGYAQKSSHAERFELGFFENRHGDFVASSSDFTGSITEKSWRAEICRGVGQTAHFSNGRADCSSLGECFRFVRVGEPKHFRILRRIEVLFVIHFGCQSANDVLGKKSSPLVSAVSEPVESSEKQGRHLAKFRYGGAYQRTDAFGCTLGTISKMKKNQSNGHSLQGGTVSISPF